MTRPSTHAEVVAILEQRVDDAHRRVLRSTTDPARGLPRFKKKAEQALDERVLDVLLALLAEIHADVVDTDRLRAESYERIDGPGLAAEDTRLRRRLQGIPESVRAAD
jgi:hypothetical protein